MALGKTKLPLCAAGVTGCVRFVITHKDKALLSLLIIVSLQAVSHWWFSRGPWARSLRTELLIFQMLSEVVEKKIFLNYSPNRTV